MDYNLTKLKKDFHDDGFVQINEFFAQDQIQEIKKELDIFIQKHAKNLVKDEINYTGNGEINSIHRLAGFDSQFEGFFSDLLNQKRITTLVGELLNDKAEPRKAEFFAKPAYTGLKSPMHQDNFYWGIEDHNGLTIWCCLTESNEKNGGIRYVKGSHKKGLIKHEDSFAPGSSQMIPLNILDQFSTEDFITPDLKSGDIVIHHSLMIHGSLENKSSIPRPGLTLQYKAQNSNYNSDMVKYYYSQLEKQLKARE